jgi:PadR family transcriptional regulator, regulatory protein PadR
MLKNQKEAQSKLVKGLLDFIVLQILSTQPMHGYQLISCIRKSYGVYFGPSTVYPLLTFLEKRGYLKGNWNMDAEKPRKVFFLTEKGMNALSFAENSLNFICTKLAKNSEEPEISISQ